VVAVASPWFSPWGANEHRNSPVPGHVQRRDARSARAKRLLFPPQKSQGSTREASVYRIPARLIARDGELLCASTLPCWRLRP
jgi:hypothetical protein